MKIRGNMGGIRDKLNSAKWGKDLLNLRETIPVIKDAIFKGTGTTVEGVSNSALALYGRLFITKQDLVELAEDLEDQGGRYREL